MLTINIVSRKYNSVQKITPSSKFSIYIIIYMSKQTLQITDKNTSIEGAKSTNQCSQREKIKEVCKDLPDISTPIPAKKKTRIMNMKKRRVRN